MSYSPGISGLGGLAEGFASSYNQAHQANLNRELDQRHQLANVYLQMLPNLRPEALPEALGRLTQIYATPITKPIAKNKQVTDVGGFLNTPVSGGQPTNVSPQVPLGPPTGFQVNQPSPATPGGVSTPPSPNAGLTPPPNIIPTGVPTQTTQLGQQTLAPPPVSPMYTPEERIAQQVSAAGGAAGAQEEAKLQAFNTFLNQMKREHPDWDQNTLFENALLASGRSPYGMLGMLRQRPEETVPDPNSPTGFSRKVYDAFGNVTRLEPGAQPPANASRLGDVVPDKQSPTGFSRREYDASGNVLRLVPGATPPTQQVRRFTQRVEKDVNGNLVKVSTFSGPAGSDEGGSSHAEPITGPDGNPLHGPLSQAAKTSLEQTYMAQGLMDRVRPDLESVVGDMQRGGNIWDSVQQRLAWRQYQQLGLDPSNVDPDSMASMLPNVDPRLARLMPTIAMLQVVGAQPYLRSVRNFNFVQQIQTHLPNPELDSPQLMLEKLNQLGPNLQNLVNAVYRSEGITGGTPKNTLTAPPSAGGGGPKKYSPGNPFAPQQAVTQ